MLKTILIGDEKRPIHFGYGAKRRLDTIIQKLTIDLSSAHPSMGVALMQNRAAVGAILVGNTEFQIQLLKVGLEEGRRIATGLRVVEEIDETTICAWLDVDPRPLDEALELYAEQTTIIAAKKAGEDVEKYKAKMMAEMVAGSNLTENPNGTVSSASPSAGSE
jgi:hypothetical protein